MLTPTLWRHARNSPFHQLQQRLLNTFARNIPGDRRILGLACDFIDFVDIHDPALRSLNVIFGGLQQFEDDILNIFAHVARFSQRRCIRHGKRNIKDPCQCLRQQCFAAPSWADQQYV